MPDGVFRDRLARLAAGTPDVVVAYALDGAGVTSASLLAAADRVRRGLAGRRGRVTVRATNTIDALAALHGVWLAGCSAVLISAITPAAEAERRTIATSAVASVDLSRSPAIEFRDGGPCDPAEAAVIFTSGTTGVAKAASIPFRALEASVRAIDVGLGLPPDGRPLVDPPRPPTAVFVSIAHMGGLLATQSAWSAGKPVLLVPKFEAELAFSLVERFGLSTLSLTPAMVYDLAFAEGERALGAVKSVSVGTAALPEATRLAFERRYRVPILRNYGQTELAGAIAFERYDDVKAGRRPPLSVGRVAPGVEVRIVGPDGTDVGDGVGEIWARGRSSMAGYLGGDGRPSAASMPDGWVATGDLGSIDADGFVSVLGRVRDMLICGGFNVYPAVVEAAVNDVPGVLDSAVAGLEDARLGEVPVVAVVAEPGAGIELDATRTLLRERLAPYELPRAMRVVDAIPRTPNGKVDRPAVARLFADEPSRATRPR